MNQSKHPLSAVFTNHKAIIIAFLGFASFSISDTSSKWLTQSYEIPLIIWCISSFSVLFAILLSPFLGGLKQTLQTKHKRIHFLRSACNTIISFLVTLAFAKLPLATTYTFIFMSPFFATLFAIPLFKERVEPRSFISLLGGFLGVLIVLRPGLEGFNPWFLVPLASSLFIATLFLLARPLSKEDPVLCLAFYPALFNMVVLGPFVLMNYDLPALSDLPFFAIAGLFVAGGLTGLGIAFRIGKAAIISSFQYSQMVWAVLLGYFIFGDWPDNWTFLGASIIILSGLYLIHAEHRASKMD